MNSTQLQLNKLNNRNDLQQYLLQILEPLESCYVENGLKVGSSGASFSPSTILLEGYSRLFWGLGPLIAGSGRYKALSRHMTILKNGTNPESPWYWGKPTEIDQRSVEMASIALSLCLAPDVFWDTLNSKEQDNLYTWLSSIESACLPSNNWHFFRILVCTAFRRLGLPVNEKAEKASFDLIESCYRSDGWYVDGDSGNYDLYNPLGFHFYGLVYAALMKDTYPERSAVYIERARLFAAQYLHYFREDGSIVPFGRSLAYRFGAVAFFSACAFAEQEFIPWGSMKGIILRHFRWWDTQAQFDTSGLLTIGYGYPNLIMAEQYNSPGSPYWGLKSFLPLALSADHPFWQAEEQELPECKAHYFLSVPKYLLARSTEDVQLLCPGRYPGWEAVQAAAKYCKFAYSARFGFCVSHGGYGLEKTGCDSSLVLSEGDNYWRERRHCQDQCGGENWIYSRWLPWPDVHIESFIAVLGSWHIRIHKINSSRTLQCVEGGFSVPEYEREREAEPVLYADDYKESKQASTGTAAISYPWAATEIYALEQHLDTLESEYKIKAPRVGSILKPEPNLNILHPSVRIPVLSGSIEPGIQLFACIVHAGDKLEAEKGRKPRIQQEQAGSWLLFDGNNKLCLRFNPNTMKAE